MRYLVAMIFAVVAAALTTKFLAAPAADWIVAQQKFESSDDVENLHQMAFLGTNVVGLMFGWIVGWVIGGPLRSGPRPE